MEHGVFKGCGEEERRGRQKAAAQATRRCLKCKVVVDVVCRIVCGRTGGADQSRPGAREVDRKAACRLPRDTFPGAATK